MSTATIGIKVADRSYYPILEKDSASRKRLVLTTARDHQENVQIDLYENHGEEMESAQYVGSLLIEHIAPAGAGEAEIEFLVGIDAKATLSASARESSSGESQSLSVSLESLSAEGIYDIPEFELGDELESWDDTSAVETESSAEPVSATDPDEEYAAVGYAEQEAIVERRRPVMLALFILFAMIGVLLVGFLLFQLLDGPRVPPLEAIGEGADRVSSGAEPAAGGGPAIAAGARSPAQPQPVANESLGGTWYWIRWGDTLWGLSSSFYRNPWLFRLIAEQNNIVDPDLIFAGARLFIPSR